MTRGRWAPAAVVVAVTLLVVTAAPASAATQLAVASSNSTDTDFNNAQTLDDLTVVGSGESAYVEIASSSSTTTFTSPSSTQSYTAPSTADELQIYARGSPGQEGEDGDGGNGAPGGAAGVAEGSVSVPGGGSYTVYLADGSNSPLGDGGSGSDAQDSCCGSGGNGGAASGLERDSDGALLVVGEGGGGGGGDGSAASGGGGGGARGGSGGNSYDFIQADGEDAEGSGNGGDGGDGSGVDGEGGPPEAGGDGGASFHGDVFNTATGTSTSGARVEVTAISEPLSGTYVGQTHSVDDAQEARANLTLTDASATVTVEENTGSGWSSVASTTTSSTGTVSLDVSSATNADLRTRVEFTRQDSSAVARLHNESILFNARSPTVDNATASPTGVLTQAQHELSIDAADADFPLAQGDSVTVEFYTNKSGLVGTDTLGANLTADATHTFGQGGNTEWWAEATDAYGLTQRSANFSIESPSAIFVRNERNHSDLVDSPLTVSGTFFGETQIFERRNVSDGTIELSGLPLDQEFIVEVEPNNDNWTSRALYLTSIYDQQGIYLLNTSAVDTVESRFVLDDPTGQFGSSTILSVERPINASNTTDWRKIHADEFGAEGVTATLEEGQRYRILVRNQDGLTQVVGPYRAEATETVEVQPGTPSVPIGEFEGGWAANAVLDNTTLEYRFSDPQQETDSLTVWIHEKGNESNRLVANQTYFDLGNVSATETLTANQSEKTWVVNFVVDRDGEEIVRTVEVSNRADIFPSLPDPWGPIIGIGLLLMLAGAFSILNAKTGAVVVASVGGILWYIGLMGGGTSAAGIVLGLFVAVLAQLYSTAGP